VASVHRGGLLALLIVVVSLIAPAAADATQVTIDSDSASIETLQDVGTALERVKDKNGSDFLGFGENLNPPTLQSGEGKADAFAQQASTIVTGTNPPLPLSPIFGIGVSGRALASARKGNGGPGVPVSDPNGSFSAEFSTDGSTPFQFSGFIHTNDNDGNDCATITVNLTGPFSRSFAASDGGDCGASKPNQKGFVIEDDLPAGSYNLDVEYDAEVNPDDPGEAFTGRAAADVDLSFFPPETHITSSNVQGAKHKARFRFAGTGKFNGFDCALVRGNRAPRFRDCRSPKSFSNLRSGRYTFEARALGRGGPDATPATKRFTIP
jgi:hypothetical protein